MRCNPNLATRTGALLALAALAFLGALRPAAAQETLRTWSLSTTGGGDVALIVKYERRSGGSNYVYNSAHTVPLSALHGLSAADVAGPPERRRFEMAHDAGKLVFDGTVGAGRGSGTFDVEPDPSFQRELARRGIRPATNGELLELALGDFKLATLDAASASGFERPDPADLVNASNRGITADYLRSFKDVPLAPKSLRAVALLRDHGVTGEYVRAFADAGYRPISIEDLTLARDHGVDARQAAAIHAAMPSLTMKSLALLRDHGVPGDYIVGIDRLGLRPSAADIVRMHDYGVTVAFLQRLHDHGYANLSTDDIIKLSTHGI